MMLVEGCNTTEKGEEIKPTASIKTVIWISYADYPDRH